MNRKPTIPALFLLLGCALSVNALQETELNDPEEISGEFGEAAPGLMGPDLVDVDGDGKLDLVLGSSRGGVFFRKNVGTEKEPEFGEPKALRTGKGDIRLNRKTRGPISAQMVDFDGDGNLDIVTGTYEGFVHLFRGKKDGIFEEPRMIEDRNGNPVHLGAFWNREKGKWDKDPTLKWTDLCMYPLAVDWDEDGDMDLLMGGNGGILGLRLNEEGRLSDKTRLVVAGKKAVRLKRYLSPAFADWDGDGRRDLLCTDSSGKLHFYRNLSKKGAPRLETPKPTFLIHPGVPFTVDPKKRYGGRYGGGMRLAVGDLNSDGKMHLIVGTWDVMDRGHVWLFSRK